MIQRTSKRDKLWRAQFEQAELRYKANRARQQKRCKISLSLMKLVALFENFNLGYREIGRQLGISGAGAHQFWQTYLTEIVPRKTLVEHRKRREERKNKRLAMATKRVPVNPYQEKIFTDLQTMGFRVTVPVYRSTGRWYQREKRLIINDETWAIFVCCKPAFSRKAPSSFYAPFNLSSSTKKTCRGLILIYHPNDPNHGDARIFIIRTSFLAEGQIYIPLFERRNRRPKGKIDWNKYENNWDQLPR